MPFPSIPYSAAKNYWGLEKVVASLQRPDASEPWATVMTINCPLVSSNMACCWKIPELNGGFFIGKSP